MRLTIALLAITLMLAQATVSVHHDYELSRGRQMWLGFQRAVHYFDRFTLLSTRLSDVKGLMTSYYPFVFSNEWSLTFEMRKKGADASRKDGFMLLLSPQTITAYEGEEEGREVADFLDVIVS